MIPLHGHGVQEHIISDQLEVWKCSIVVTMDQATSFHILPFQTTYITRIQTPITVTATASVIEQGLYNFNISPVPASDFINIFRQYW